MLAFAVDYYAFVMKRRTHYFKRDNADNINYLRV